MDEMRLVTTRRGRCECAGVPESRFQADTTRPDGNGSNGGFLRGDIPSVQEQPIGDQQIVDAIRAVDSDASEADLELQAGKISQDDLDKATTVANENSAAFENAVDQTNRRIFRA